MKASLALAGLFAVAFLVPVAAVEQQDSPVTKVVELIRALKTKIEADGKHEQAVFDKFACWCEETTDRKAQAITAAMKEIKRLGVQILGLKGTVGTRAYEIDVLNKQIRENQDAQREATMMREKNNAAYVAEKQEMEDTLGALEKGILALQGAGTKGAAASFLEGRALAKEVSSHVRSAVLALPSDSPLTPAQEAALASFLQQPAAFLQKSQYAPQSGTISGILKDMYDTFSTNVEKGVRTESDQVMGYEQLMSIKEKEFKTLTAELMQKTKEEAEAQSMVADASLELGDTTKQMQADTKFFDETKASCSTKADEWSERVRARTEELHGIDKGLSILDSDDAKELFAKAIKPGKETSSLLQVRRSVHEDSSPRAGAFRVLQAAASKSGSKRLAAIALQLRHSGHFEVVIEEIVKMREVLRAEEKDDFDQRDWCKEETFKNEQEAARYEYKVEKANHKLNKMEDKLELLESTLLQTNSEIEDTETEIADMESVRNDEHDAFKEAKSDDEGAVTLLTAAIKAMSSFYKNNNKDMGEIQGPGGDRFLQIGQDPNKGVAGDEDTMPDATFSDSGKSKGESKGIVSLLTMLNEDLQDEIKNGVKAEIQAQADFEKALSKAQTVLKNLKKKATDLRGAISLTNEAIDDATQSKEDNQEGIDAEKEYLEEIKPDCDWLYENFDERREKRAVEVEGLIEAKGMLAGNAPPPPAGTAWTAPA